MKYEIDLPSVDELAARVVEQVSEHLLTGGVRHGDDYEDGVRDKIETRIVEAVAAKVDAEVAAIVEAHLTKPVMATNEFGEPVGEPLTLRARIAKRVEAWLTEKVDRDGKPYNREQHYYQKEFHTRAEWAITKAVEEIAAGEMAAGIKAAADQVRAQIKGKTTEAVQQTVARLLGLPS